MEGVFKKTLNHSANQEFYQSANLTQFHENQEERELLSPEDEYYFSNYEQYETALFAKQTNVTTNINTSTTKKKEPRKIKREPHNAIERKRRNNINENIKYLGQLLPENLCQGRISKGTILKGSVLYVKTLKDQLTNYKLRLDYLERQLAAINNNQQLPL